MEHVKVVYESVTSMKDECVTSMKDVKEKNFQVL
jgi:hypothetical protein